MSRRETDALLDKPPKAPNQARRGLALKIVVALCSAAAVAVVLPRASRGGGLRASPAALKAEALKSGLVKEVDKNRWLPECLAWWQMAGAWPTSENPDSEEKNQAVISTSWAATSASSTTRWLLSPTFTGSPALSTSSGRAENSSAYYSNSH